ncbi:hypothetical protein ACU8KH_02264 [Lachancea thermotolerans]
MTISLPPLFLLQFENFGLMLLTGHVWKDCDPKSTEYQRRPSTLKVSPI